MKFRRVILTLEAVTDLPLKKFIEWRDRDIGPFGE